MKKTKNPLYKGQDVWGATQSWLSQKKAYLDKNQDKPINQIAVFKEANGNWRWVTLSSSAFRDQDNEIVSTKALYEDVMRADERKEYGTLRWWHVKNADLGVCDFNMMYNHVLIESGTFLSEKIATAIKNVSDRLGVSIGFFHPVTEPDKNGIFHNIRRFERSLLPKELASNPLTALVVKQKELKNMVDVQQKIDILKSIVGEDLAGEILGNADHSEKEALAQNIEFKASKQVESEMPSDEEEEEITPPAGLTEEEEKCWWLNNGKKKPKKSEKEDIEATDIIPKEESEDEDDEEIVQEKETVILKRPKKQPEEEGEQPAPAQQAQPAPAQQVQPAPAQQAQPAPAQQKPAPPKPADYQRAESEPVAQRPAKAAVQVEDKAPDAPKAEPAQVEKPAPAPAPKPQAQQPEGEGDYEEVEMEEVPLPEVIGNMTIEEFGELLASALSEALMPYLQTVKEAKAGLEKARLDFEVSTKEKDASKEEVEALKEKVKKLSGALEKAAEKIADLEGDVPAIASQYVASQAEDTILGDEDTTLKNARPSEGGFIDWLQPNK